MPEEFAEQTETADVESAETTETEFVEAAEVSVDDNSAEAAVDDIAEEGAEFEKTDDGKDDSENLDAEFEASENKEEEAEETPVQYSQEEYAALQEEADALRAEVEALREFKLNVENAQKDALINSYYMLSDEDKREVMEHKAEFSLDEIKAKLAVIYVEKNVDFSALEEQSEVETDASEEEDPAMTFSLDSEPADFVSPLQELLRSKQSL